MHAVINNEGAISPLFCYLRSKSRMKSTEEIKDIIETILQGTDLFLVDLKVSPENSIEVYIDSLKGINVDSCVTLSKQLDAKLDRDVEDFELTVSSAGIGYPFKVIQQYEKNLGRQVEVKLQNGEKLQGTLKSYSNTGIVIECEEKIAVEGKKKKSIGKMEKEIHFTDIKEVKDIVVF